MHTLLSEEAASVAFFLYKFNCTRDRFTRSDFINILFSAQLIFDDIFAGALTDGDSDRIADQIRILELDARTLITIVQYNFHARSLKFIVDLFGQRSLRFILCLDQRNDHMVRSN